MKEPPNTKRRMRPRPQPSQSDLELSPNQIRLLIDPSSQGGVTHLIWYPQNGSKALLIEISPANKAPAIIGLALAFISWELVNTYATRIPQITVKNAKWLYSSSDGTTFFDTLGNAFENLGQKLNGNALASRLIKELAPHGLDLAWFKPEALSGKHPARVTVTLAKYPQKIHFRRHGHERDLETANELLELARELEDREESWTKLFTPATNPPPPPPPPEFATLRLYLETVINQCRYVHLAGIDPRAANAEDGDRLELRHIYIPLKSRVRQSDLDEQQRQPLTTHGQQSKRAVRLRAVLLDTTLGKSSQERTLPELSLLKVASTCPRLMVTGDPGSGKSTFMRHLCLALANLCLPCEDRLPVKILGWRSIGCSAAIPVFIRLIEFARTLPLRPPTSAEPEELWDFFVSKSLKPQSLGNLAGGVKSAIEQGQALVIFDGLDEVPTGPQREHVKRAILAFAGAAAFKASRVLVTCRTRAYEDKVLQFPDEYVVAPLAEFNERRRRLFAIKWYREYGSLGVVDSTEATRRAADLIHRLDQPALLGLSGRPMFLTAMAYVHTRKGNLPEARALLYAYMVECLVESWDGVKFGDTAPLRNIFDRAKAERGRSLDANGLIRVLSRLAFEALQRAGDATVDADAIGDIPYDGPDGLLERLGEFFGSLDLGAEAVRLIDHRAGLLISTDPGRRRYAFPHRSFTEYLAGCHLYDREDFVEEALRLVASDAGVAKKQGNAQETNAGYWDEVLKWVAGWVAHVQTLARAYRDVTDLAEELVDKDGGESEGRHRRAMLAAELLIEMGREKSLLPKHGAECREKVEIALLGFTLDTRQSPKSRAKAGETLGRLGDPRPGVGIRRNASRQIEEMFEWLSVPSRGSIEKSPSTGTLPEFYISRYPVTVAQYAAFLAEEGYATEEWWQTDASKAWLRNQRSRGPEDYQTPFQNLNHPQVGVCFHEAQAFCAWATARALPTTLPDHADKMVKWEVRLPTDAQWTRAACGDTHRDYAWGNATDDQLADHCNCQMSKIDATSAVGIFPNGRSWSGADDMTGNVWEWCDDWYRSSLNPAELIRKYPWLKEDRGGQMYRVLRGGSWFGDFPENLRVSFRFNFHPEYRYNFIGFRCVLVHGSLSQTGL